MTIHIFGGGTIMHVRSHLALCAPAKGRTARQLAQHFVDRGAQVKLHLTGLADADSVMDTNDDVEARLRDVLADPATRAVIFNVALCDVGGQIGDVPSGKYAQRLQTREMPEAGLAMTLRPTPKLLGLVHQLRPDVKTVGFKTTADETPEMQVARANRMSGEHGVTWVLANDVVTRNNIVLPGGGAATLSDAVYCGPDRQRAILALVERFSAEVAHG